MSRMSRISLFLRKFGFSSKVIDTRVRFPPPAPSSNIPNEIKALSLFMAVPCTLGVTAWGKTK